MTELKTDIRDNTLYIVIPCYNEEEALPITAARLKDKMETLIKSGTVSPLSRVMLVDDGSKDSTWEIICRLHQENELFCGVKLSRNRGHQNALLAGLMSARERADITVSMDADLQDDVDALDRMIEEYHRGCEIVYGVRNSREQDSFFKRTTARGFYKILNSLGGEVVYDHADYRLMSRRALDGLALYGEVNLFLRGIVPMLGYKTAVVEYDRGERVAGESKYPLKKMLALAADGVTSLSVKPLRFFLWTGVVILVLGLVLLLAFAVEAVLSSTFEAWKLILPVLLVLGGLVLLGIGVVGEYVGKIYLETKKRPLYIIEKTIG